MSDETVDHEAVARWLYAVLDDIDTASDHAKDDDAKYREVVERLQQLKNEVGRSRDGYSVEFRNPPEPYGMTRLWHPCNASTEAEVFDQRNNLMSDISEE